MVKDTKVKARYHHLIANSFVEVSHLTVKAFSDDSNCYFSVRFSVYIVGPSV